MNDASAVCQAFLNCINDRDFPALGALLHPEAELGYPGFPLVRKRKVVVVFLRHLFAKFKVLQFTVKNIIAQNETIAVLWENEGIRLDDKVYSNKGVTIFTLEEGKIRSISDYFKFPVQT